MLRELLNEGTDVEKVLKPALTRLNAYHVKMQSLKELMEDDSKLEALMKSVGLSNDLVKVISMIKKADLELTHVISNLEHEVDFQTKFKQ